MSDQMILQHCSPTLAGIKTGNLVTCTFRTREEVVSDLRRWNRALWKKGLRVIALKYMENKVLLYIFRPSALKKDLSDPMHRKILEKCGYSSETEAGCIRTLIEHLRVNSSFPHEIGLFIGYPPEDVIGFIENGGSSYKYSGMWKVYGNVEKTKSLFDKYRHCTEVYMKQAGKGRTLEELAVKI